jgi:CDP-diglyceride synthetase
VTSFLDFLHQRFAIALMVMAVVLGLWGTYQFFRHKSVSGGFRSTFLLLIGLTAVQGLAGVGLYVSGQHPARGILHVVYGIFAIVFLPAAFTYGARGDRAREAAFLATACWIVLIAYGRGFATGR